MFRSPKTPHSFPTTISNFPPLTQGCDLRVNRSRRFGGFFTSPFYFDSGCSILSNRNAPRVFPLHIPRIFGIPSLDTVFPHCPCCRFSPPQNTPNPRPARCAPWPLPSTVHSLRRYYSRTHLLFPSTGTLRQGLPFPPLSPNDVGLFATILVPSISNFPTSPHPSCSSAALHPIPSCGPIPTISSPFYSGVF